MGAVTMIIREPLPGDAEEIAAVHVHGWRDTYAHLLPERFYDDDAYRRRVDLWTRIIDEPNPANSVCIAEIDGAIVGFGMAGPARGDDAVRDTELYSIYVETAHHGSGAAQALLDAVLGDAPAQLWVVADNARAQAFYRRNGFRPDGATQVEEHLENLSDIRMVR
jgi:ribosomal protein S18 acetylase RimI-like enzyme